MTKDADLRGVTIPRYYTAVYEHNEANDGGRNQHLHVKTQPGKVDRYLLAKVGPVVNIFLKNFWNIQLHLISKVYYL